DAEESVSLCLTLTSFFFPPDNSNVILNGNLHCHFKSISQIFARPLMEGDTVAKKLSCMPTVR
uniref:Uncharacterized protein n=1 Tax=Canis lupus dingo TaxID=286419 RepID=A0A8C0L679_CANLU